MKRQRDSNIQRMLVREIKMFLKKCSYRRSLCWVLVEAGLQAFPQISFSSGDLYLASVGQGWLLSEKSLPLTQV